MSDINSNMSSMDLSLLGFVPMKFEESVSQIAAALMAVDHFHAGDEGVIKEMSSMTANCSVRVKDLRFLDSEASGKTVSRLLANELLNNTRFDAVLGPYLRGSALAAVPFCTGKNVPMISHGNIDTHFTYTKENPTTFSTTVDFNAMGQVAVNYFQSKGRDNFLATMGISAIEGEQMRRAVDFATRRTQPAFSHVVHYVISPPYIGFEPDRGVGYACQKIKESGYRNIFLILRESGLHLQLPSVANYAEEFGLNTGEHVWIIGGDRSLRQEDLIRFAAESNNPNVTKLINGMGMVTVLDGFTYAPEDDSFLQEWKKQNASMVERVNQLLPSKKESSPDDADQLKLPDNYFQTHSPKTGAGFMYDSLMSLVLGKCREEQLESNNDGDENRMLQVKVPPPSSPFIKHLLDVNFTGATGRVQFKESTRFYGNRPRETLTYGAWNIRPIQPQDQVGDRENYTMWYYLTDVHTGPTGGGQWTTTNDGPFVFASGATVPPPLNRDLPEQNYIREPVHITGLVFMSIALASIALASAFVYCFRSSPIIRGAQPVFLFALLLGAAIMACAILTLAFDESYGWSQSMLDSACMTTPWLLAVGYNVMYLALFSKLWRINEVMQLARRKVKIKHVLGPFLAVMAAIVGVLIAWTVADPLQWVREEIDEQTGESYGQCKSEHSLAFALPLVGLSCLSTFACGYMAYKCRDIDRRFADTNSIAQTIFVHVQVLLIGIPIEVILAESSADAKFLGRSLLIFAIVMSTVSLMTVPKVIAVYTPDNLPMRSRHSAAGVVHVSGLHRASNPSSSKPGSTPSQVSSKEQVSEQTPDSST